MGDANWDEISSWRGGAGESERAYLPVFLPSSATSQTINRFHSYLQAFGNSTLASYSSRDDHNPPTNHLQQTIEDKNEKKFQITVVC